MQQSDDSAEVQALPFSDVGEVSKDMEVVCIEDEAAVTPCLLKAITCT